MPNLTQHAGGGSVSELFLARDYGGTGQCNVQNLGYAGGKIEFFIQAKFEPDTGASDSRLWSWLSTSASYWNFLVQIYDSDHATVERRNKMRILMAGTTGNVIDLLSNIEVADSNLHYIFFTGDPATGNFEFTIDGKDADDTTYSNRSATSGTMDTGANDDLGFMGYVNTANNRVKGSVAYVGLRFDHATAGTYSDVFNEVGGVTLDLGGFAHPQWDWFSNVGQPNVNWGTNTAMTFTGSATDLWVRRVDNLGLGLDTTATAVAASIRAGETAWVNGLQVTGTQIEPPSLSNTLLWAKTSDSNFAQPGSAINAWLDKSAAGNNAQNFVGTRNFITNVQNGHPGVYMNSTSAQVRFPTLLTNKTFTIIAVIKGGASPTGTYLNSWHDGSAASGRGYISKSGSLAYHDGTGYKTASTGTVAANTCKLHAWRADGSVLQGALNDGSFTGSTDISSAVAPYATQFRVGDIASGQGNSAYDIYWLELIVTDDAISDAEWADVQAYINDKFSIW